MANGNGPPGLPPQADRGSVIPINRIGISVWTIQVSPGNSFSASVSSKGRGKITGKGGGPPSEVVEDLDNVPLDFNGAFSIDDMSAEFQAALVTIQADLEAYATNAAYPDDEAVQLPEG